MTEKEINEGNAIIATFMGLHAGGGMFMIKGNPIQQPASQLQYHKDWNWLMEVKFKIEDEDEFCVRTDHNDVFITDSDGIIIKENPGHPYNTNLITLLWKVCVDFTQWYMREQEKEREKANQKREKERMKHINAGNKLILEYMGFTPMYEVDFERRMAHDELFEEQDRMIEKERYDQSWDKLMQVVGCINADTGELEASREYLESNNYIKYFLGGVMVDNDLDGVWSEAVQYIQWYKQNIVKCYKCKKPYVNVDNPDRCPHCLTSR